jgi:hypothetical protein
VAGTEKTRHMDGFDCDLMTYLAAFLAATNGAASRVAAVRKRSRALLHQLPASEDPDLESEDDNHTRHHQSKRIRVLFGRHPRQPADVHS